MLENSVRKILIQLATIQKSTKKFFLKPIASWSDAWNLRKMTWRRSTEITIRSTLVDCNINKSYARPLCR